MRIFKVFFFIITTLFVSQSLYAQKKPVKKPVATSTQRFKAPKLETQLDNYKDSVAISADEAVRIIGLPLKIFDDKKNQYTISSYQFLYKKKAVTEDEQTGKVTPTSSISSDRFKVSPLPELWLNLIKQQVKAGEEFYFFDVIAKDAQGRVMYASNLKITIQ